MQQEPRQPGCVRGLTSTHSAANTLPCTAVDEQNAQTQEQEGFVLGLSESEEKKDLKPDDRTSLGEGAAKGRSLRRGTAARGPLALP